MYIACRGGHNGQAQGANGYVNEVTEDRKINSAMIKYLNLAGVKTINVSPGNCESMVDLRTGINKANAEGVDLFLSNHLNAGGGQGSEVYYYTGNTVSRQIATQICSSLFKLGFKNRGAKPTKGFYELNNSKMDSVIIESFFVDCQSDTMLYQKLGADLIGKAIAEGITGKLITEKQPETLKVTTKDIYKTINARNVNVRSSRSLTENNILDTLPLGTILKIGSTYKDGWTNVYFGSHGGFVATRYLS